MTLGAALVIWWFVAGAISAEYFTFVERMITSWPGDLVMFGLLWALVFHALNGIRHLIWDAGCCMEIESVNRSGWFVIAVSAVLTVAIAWIV